jgi:hypothetical protein
LSPFQVVYGLRLATNTEIPGLPFQGDSKVLDVSIQLKNGWAFPTTLSNFGENLYSSSHSASDGEPNLDVALSSGKEYFGFFYCDGTRFAVERRGHEVWADWPENYSLEDGCTYLVGPVMGFVLRLRGTVCLHASAVAIGDRAIALVGLPGAGKSTTAAAFACNGFPVISDDVVALVEEGAQFLAQPGYPRVNLWPDSVRVLFGSEDALPLITPTWEKHYLPLNQNGHRFASEPLPLGAIYILDRREPVLIAPAVEEIAREKAFMTLVANTYVNYLLDQGMRRNEFDVLGRLVSQIPVRRVRSPEDRSAIFSLCEVIAADAKRVILRHPAYATLVSG